MNIEVKNDEMLGRADSIYATKFYVMQKQIDELEEENQQLKKELKDIDMWNTLYNEEFDKNRGLENALDEIEKYIEEHKVKHYKLIDEPNGIDIILLENEIDYLLEIIKKAKEE